MGRPRKGWSLRQRPGRPIEVRFTHNGQEYNLGLGTRDREQAAREAERVYSETVTGKPVSRLRHESAIEAHPITEVGGEWLANSVGHLREKTREIYEVYLVQIARHMPDISDCTEQGIERFISSRLATVQSQSVRKELSVLRSVLQFAHGRGWIRGMPQIPELPKRAKGTRFAKRRRVAADAISPEEVDALLAALPEWSSSKRVKPFPIRARFVVGYELGMRPELLNVLDVPAHWSKGRAGIWILAEHDKTGTERTLPLTARALSALESVAPAEGLIFGDHDYRPALLKAALAVLPEDRARRFCGQHFRSAGGTHLAEFGNLPGVQWILGHSKISTTARYVKPSERAAAEVIDLASRRRSG